MATVRKNRKGLPQEFKQKLKKTGGFSSEVAVSKGCLLNKHYTSTITKIKDKLHAKCQTRFDFRL